MSRMFNTLPFLPSDDLPLDFVADRVSPSSLTCMHSFSSLSDADESSLEADGCSEEQAEMIGIQVGAGMYRPSRSHTVMRKSHPLATTVGFVPSESSSRSKFDFDRICSASLSGVSFSFVG